MEETITITKSVYNHILCCKDRSCFFCINEFSNVFPNKIMTTHYSNNWSNENMQKIREMREKGISQENIAKEFNVSRQTIVTRLKEIGL